jgi:hypothetical protein
MGAKEEMEERHRKKLACFQKTHGGVVKKGDIVQASRLVNSPFILEELVHMIDVSVNSKYGTDLEGITHTLTYSLQSSLESFKHEYKQDSDNNLHRQIRAAIHQVLGESRGKRDADTAPMVVASQSPNAMTMLGSPTTTTRPRNSCGIANPNLQQPYYQIAAYGLGM